MVIVNTFSKTSVDIRKTLQQCQCLALCVDIMVTHQSTISQFETVRDPHPLTKLFPIGENDGNSGLPLM